MANPTPSALPDLAHLFNASLTAGTRRAIDVREGDEVDQKRFTTLIRAAVERSNQTGGNNLTQFSPK